jgi:hydrogenase nickel incorporation protein HypB
MPHTVVTVRRDVQAEARASAAEFRAARTAAGTLVVNLISSPGAGKTSLLEATARRWQGLRSLAVLVGDIATDRDAQRLAPFAPVVQLTTGGACHLELPLVERAFAQLPTGQLDYLFVENVGNLVCPASFDLGEHVRAVMLSVTEGDDKPAKYPKAFRTSQALVINKLDLLPHVPFSIDAATADARAIAPDLAVLPISARTGEGLEAWCAWLEGERDRLLEGRAGGAA